MRGHTPAGAGVSANSASRLAQPRAPEAQIGAQRRLGLEPRAQRASRSASRQHAERIFGDEEAVLVASANVALVAHAERHSLSFNRLRRSQVRIVFSGTLWRVRQLFVTDSRRDRRRARRRPCRRRAGPGNCRCAPRSPLSTAACSGSGPASATSRATSISSLWGLRARRTSSEWLRATATSHADRAVAAGDIAVGALPDLDVNLLQRLFGF